LLLFGVMYVMLIRPQKKRMQQHQQLVASVGLGDEVVTIGGLYGTVAALRDDEIELEVSPGTKVRLVKSAIARKVTHDEEPSDAEASGEALGEGPA
ncbi:MAG: preprotein translocase subunit YajC, partial [Actinomycetota bacterium]